MGWAATTNYTNHAAVLPVLMAELGFGPVEAGFLSTAFFVTLGVACVPAGLWCDRRGPTGDPRRVLRDQVKSASAIE